MLDQKKRKYYLSKHSEHQRQIEEMQYRELETKDNEPIWKDNKLTPNKDIVLLNTERDIYKEGTTMHHCVHTCYYDRIASHEYIALHMSAPEGCTIGIRLVNDVPVLDQAYKAYNVSISDATRDIINKYIAENLDSLKEMLKTSVMFW